MLTCQIDDVDDGQAVVVTWRDSSGGAALENGTQYIVNQGTVDGGIQRSVLTIKANKMATFAADDSFTYFCSAQSSQYAESPTSKNYDVVATVLTFGKQEFFPSL